MLKGHLKYAIIIVWIFVRSLRALPADELARNAKVSEQRSYMNETLDPCDDFYEFACANWPKLHPLKPEDIRFTYFDVLQAELGRKLKTLLVAEDKTDTAEVTKVKDFYRSCLDMQVVAKSKLLAIISEFGQMPLVEGDKWNASDFDWLKTVAEIAHKYGLDILVVAAVFPDLHDASVKSLGFGQASTLFLQEKNQYFTTEFEATRNNQPAVISSNIQLFLEIPEATANAAAKEIFDFEIALAQGLPDAGLLPADFLKSTTLEQMQSSHKTSFDVKQLVSTTYGEIPPFACYEQSDYLQNLIEVIARTPKRVVANYIFYKLTDAFTFSVYDDTDAQQDVCIAEVKKIFPINLENLVYRTYNSQQTKQDLDDLWQTFKRAFEEVLRSSRLSWLAADTRQYAIEKLNALAIVIPAIALNATAETDKLVVNKEDFVENVRQLKIAAARKNRDSLYRPLEDVETDDLDSFTAQNIVTKNLVTVPVGFLQPQYMWTPALPNAINFAQLGSQLAHELIHAFDDVGRLFDADGITHQWWDTNSIQAFNEHKQCFVEQYKRYEYGGVPLPEPASQAENIADNAGVRLAYRAYLKWYEDSSRSRPELERETLPNFNYSHKQLFFISYAQLWCTSTNPENRALEAAADEHAPGKFRVTGPLSNLKEFSEEFNCPVGSTMNPIKKCHIY